MKIKLLAKHSNALKSPWILLFSVGFNTVDGDLDQYKLLCLYLVQHMLHQIKAQQLNTDFLPYLSLTFLQKNFNTKIRIFHKLLVLENCRKVLRSPWKGLEFYSNLPVWTQAICRVLRKLIYFKPFSSGSLARGYKLFHAQLNWEWNLSCSLMLKCQQLLAF